MCVCVGGLSLGLPILSGPWALPLVPELLGCGNNQSLSSLDLADVLLANPTFRSLLYHFHFLLFLASEYSFFSC